VLIGHLLLGVRPTLETLKNILSMLPILYISLSSLHLISDNQSEKHIKPPSISTHTL
jgi:hypothetical protein